MKVNEVGEAIHEVYESKGDILFGNEKVKINPVRNLGGHNIEQYEIHAKVGFHAAIVAYQILLIYKDFARKSRKENSSYRKGSFSKKSL